MNLTQNLTDGECATLIVGFVVGAVLGIVLCKLASIVHGWIVKHKAKKEEASAAHWIRHRSLDHIAKMAEAGELAIGYPMRLLLLKIANQIEVGDEGTSADESNEELIAMLMSMGQLKGNEKF